ncbi:MAG: biotin-dependent carboxyltransferase [Gammaproteobacteria bacterium]|nr:biotin-dependent carboxyltransferase [Gammaproteobacteria bacterium]
MIRVEQAGLGTRIEDAGRPGWQHLGIATGGAMDPHAARAANALVGNEPGVALLEIPLAGPVLSFERGLWLALTGADLSPELDGRAVDGWRPLWCPAGSRLRFGRPSWGCRAYLAVSGGLDLPEVLGSRATDERAGIGGLEGRTLRAGDVLKSLPARLPPPEAPERPWQPDWGLAWREIYGVGEAWRLQLIPGEAWDGLEAAGQAALLDGSFRVAARADRMGLCLDGPALRLRETRERLSAGVAPGCLQLPPSGLPILLGAACQTTGGYPLLGRVASQDRPRWAQARPGDALAFELGDVATAQSAWRREERLWQMQKAELCRRYPYQR